MQSSNCNKTLNLKNLKKIQIGVETRVDGLHAFSGLELKKHHFCGEISDLEQRVAISPNTLKWHIFCDPFIFIISILF